MPTTRRNLIRVLAGTGLVLGAGAFGLTRCDPMPEEAIVAWGGPGPQETEPRRRALAFALLAPNPHNKQPWIADLRRPGEITFLCDRDRLLPQTDPVSRQIVIGCGAFLELLRMAAAAQGFRTDLTLFPDGAWSEGAVGELPLARIVFTADPAVPQDPLFAHVLTRRTGRVAYDDAAPADAAVAPLAAAVAGLPVGFGWTADPGRVGALKDLAVRAWGVEVETDATYYESVDVYRITGAEIARHRDGLSMHGPFMWWMNAFRLFTQERARAGDRFLRDQSLAFYNGLIASSPAFAWLVTAANDRATQLAAGAAYLRLNLAATGAGLSMQPLSQALQEFPEMRALYAEQKAALGATESETVQMFVRLGRATPPGPAPRRPLDAILRV